MISIKLHFLRIVMTRTGYPRTWVTHGSQFTYHWQMIKRWFTNPPLGNRSHRLMVRRPVSWHSNPTNWASSSIEFLYSTEKYINGPSPQFCNKFSGWTVLLIVLSGFLTIPHATAFHPYLRALLLSVVTTHSRLYACILISTWTVTIQHEHPNNFATTSGPFIWKICLSVGVKRDARLRLVKLSEAEKSAKERVEGVGIENGFKLVRHGCNCQIM